MRGYTFYAELPHGRASKAGTKRYHAFNRTYLFKVAQARAFNNVCAVIRSQWNGAGHFDAVGAAFGTSNSPVTGTTASPDYLRRRCVRISEKLARQLHPALFASGLIGE